MTNNQDFYSIPDSEEIPLCSMADLSSLLDKSTPATLPKRGKEHRTVQRYVVKWRCIASMDTDGAHHGHLKDISLRGAAILHEQNFHSAEFIKLHIYVPPPPPARLPCIVGVLCKVIYTLFDSREQSYRTGVSFLKFTTEHDPKFLEDHLEKHTLRAIL